MFYNKKTGNVGENLACNYLINKGYKIIQQNFKNKIGEIDIICLSPDNTLVFVEVKMRINNNFGLPQEAINRKKQMKIKLTAQSYLKYKNLVDSIDVRFDCISIIGDEHDFEIEHLENIF